MPSNLVVIGINHDSASVAVRERVAFAPECVPKAISELMAETRLSEGVILSTCNRTEIYGWFGTEGEAALAGDEVVAWLCKYHAIALDDLATCTYRSHGIAGLTHLVRVTAGLNSMVLGEPQIFGQIKSAFAVSQESGGIGDSLSKLFPEAFRLAKRVRTDTAIGENPVSVAYAAVDLAGRIFSDLSNRTALLLGAGETIELVARHLNEAGLGKLIVANRTLKRAETLADQFGAEAILLADVTERLPSADILISSTASQLPILGKGAVEEAIKARRYRPALLIDLAIPRDIEPQVASLSDIYLYTVDDLRHVVEENVRLRSYEANKADKIVEEGVVEIEATWLQRASADVVRNYRESAMAIQQAELERALKALKSGKSPEEVMTRLSRDLTNKLIHAPTAGLKQIAKEGDRVNVSRAAELLGVPASIPSDGSSTLQ
ncbi:MAG: glutamyl-tRNA reductase [Pseudomonadota bacterium]|nr:glutamyl-tRNA reductase [Pseudomonadota bacterium]